MARRRVVSHGRRDLYSDSMASNIFSIQDLESEHNALNGEFLLYQVIVKQLLTTGLVDSSSKKKLSDHFKSDDKTDEEILLEFDNSYKKEKAIYWYTRESCIYRLLNKALRTHNIADLIVFTDFIRDLYDQLSYEQVLLLISNPTNILKVYRGQSINIDELNRIKNAKGQLLSMNSFLSTSTNKKKALEFISQRPSSDLFSTILLEITVDLNNSTKPFADVKYLSAFAEEEEILFMFGAIFRIDNINKDKKLDHWNINLTLCANEDSDLTKFEKVFEEELKGKNLLVCLGHYMMQIEKYDEAEAHYDMLLDNKLIYNQFDLANCYFGIAQVNQKKGEFNYAIQNFNLAIKYLIENPKTIDHYLIPEAYNNLASIYTEQFNQTLAFQYYEKALTFKTNNNCITHSGLSKLHIQMENYQIALEYLFNSIEKQLNTKKTTHLANTFIEIGKIYGILKQSNKSLEYFKKAIQYQEKRLSLNHPDLGYTYIAMALHFHEYGQEDKAFEYIQKTYQLQLNSLPNNHPDFCQTFKTFGIFYKKKCLYDKALEYFFKLHDNQRKILSIKHPSIADTYSIIGETYLEKQDFDNAFIYYNKLLDNQIQRLPAGNIKLSQTYEYISQIYFKKNDFDQTLIYYHKLLDNELERININDPLLENIYKNISDIYFKKKDYSQTLIYLNRLIDTQLNNKFIDQNIIYQTFDQIGNIYLNYYSFNNSFIYFDKLLFNNNNNQSDIQLFDYFKLIQDKHFEKKHLDQILIYFQYLLNKQLQISSNQDKLLFNYYQILGNICLEKQDFDQALIYFKKLLNNKSIDDELILININYIIGNIYFKKEYFKQSLKYFLKILNFKLNKQFILFNNIYLFISISFFQLSNFIQSIYYFNQLIDLNTLDHKLLIQIYHFIGKIFLKNNIFYSSSSSSSSIHYHKSNISLPKSFQINKILENNQFEQRHLDNIINYYQQLIDNQTDNFTLNDIYKIIAKIYLEKNNFNQSLIYFNKLISNENKNDLFLIEINKIISIIYYEINDFNQSFIYLDKLFYFQLDIYSLIDLYYTIAIIYFKINKYSKSFIYFNKLLDLIKQIKQINDKQIISIYKFIKKILLKMNYFNKNLFYYNENIDQFSLLNLNDIDENIFIEYKYIDQTLNYFNQQFKNNDIYIIISILYLNKNNFDDLLINLNKYLNNQLNNKMSLDNSKLTYIYQIIGFIYFNKRYLKQSLTYLYRYLNCQLINNSSDTQPFFFIGKIFSKLFIYQNSNQTDLFNKDLLTDTYKLINDIQFQNTQKDKLLNFFIKLLNNNNNNKSDKQIIYLIITNIYLEKLDYDKSLFYLIESMEYLTETTSSPNSILGDTYFNMGFVYFKKGLFNQALKDYKTALTIYNKIYPFTHQKINKLKLAIFQIINNQID